MGIISTSKQSGYQSFSSVFKSFLSSQLWYVKHCMPKITYSQKLSLLSMMQYFISSNIQMLLSTSNIFCHFLLIRQNYELLKYSSANKDSKLSFAMISFGLNEFQIYFIFMRSVKFSPESGFGEYWSLMVGIWNHHHDLDMVTHL